MDTGGQPPGALLSLRRRPRRHLPLPHGCPPLHHSQLPSPKPPGASHRPFMGAHTLEMLALPPPLTKQGHLTPKHWLHRLPVAAEWT